MDDLDEEKPTAQQKPPSGGLRWGKGGEVPAGVRTRVEEYCRTSSGLDRRPENGQTAEELDDLLGAQLRWKAVTSPRRPEAVQGDREEAVDREEDGHLEKDEELD